MEIQNNGYFSDKIDIKKGVHQGGCCSSIYFLVIAEILAITLRENEQIEGITLQQVKNLLNQFADDMDIFSLCKESSLKAILEELDKFKYQSGFTVSYEKTTMYRIGSLRHSKAVMYDLDQIAWSNEDITVLGITIAHEDMTAKNYSVLIDKTKKLLGTWQNRNLSLIGKIQVVNTLVASLFVYKMMVLPRIPSDVVKKIDALVRDFIWNSRKSKIAYNILQNPKDQGGLNLVNLDKRDTALKATWPQVLYFEEDYEKVVYGTMRCNTIGRDIWRVTLLREDVRQLNLGPEFWRDVLESWCEYNFHTDFRIENQLIWYNSHIRIQNKPFFWKDVYQKGLRLVSQLFENQQFKSEEQVFNQYGLSSLRYNSLKVAIPTSWKQFCCETAAMTYMPLTPHTYDTIIVTGETQLSRKVYKSIAEDATLLRNKYYKWIEQLGLGSCGNIYEFGKRHTDVYKLTNIPKFRSFQYRLLQRGLVTNVLLCKWGIVNSSLCYFCKKGEETVVHLVYECDEVKILWEGIKVYLQERYPKQGIDINLKNVIFNDIAVEPMCKNAINCICLVTKQYIYSQKCLKKGLNVYELKGRIRQMEYIEKYIAVKNDKLETHQKKWANVVTSNQQNMGEFIDQYVQEM